MSPALLFLVDLAKRTKFNSVSTFQYKGSRENTDTIVVDPVP